MNTVLKTFHASPERASEEELARQMEIIENERKALSIIDAIPMMVVILNSDRQIVFANNQFKVLVDAGKEKCCLGQRLGEAVSCMHAREMEGGCGTSEACTQCGAVNAILYSQRLEEKGVDECRLTTDGGTSFDFFVWATPYKIGDEKFTICALKDIESENRRKALERIFFHDVLNTAGGLRGFIGMLSDADEEEMRDFLSITDNLADRLIDEIKAQRILSLAENNELELNVKSFSTAEILEDVKIIYEKHEVAENRQIVVDSNSYDVVVSSDKTLYRRVLGNLVKNALEAIPEGESVTIGCTKLDNGYQFFVSNSAVMPQQVKLQLFQRSFSTKGFGRGLGTYSVKLITERYLGGTVHFTSEEGEGTTFYITFENK